MQHLASLSVSGAATVGPLASPAAVPGPTPPPPLATGSNVIADGAFSGASGLPMVIQNSGNNVLIQSATIVNVQLQ